MKVRFFGMNAIPPNGAFSKSDLRMEQFALLKSIETILNQAEAQWRDFTNRLPASPERAEFTRENSLLPSINEKLRPALTQLERLMEQERNLEVQHIFQQAERVQQKMLIYLVLIALAILAASLVLAKTVLKPIEQLALAATEVAAGRRTGNGCRYRRHATVRERTRAPCPGRTHLAFERGCSNRARFSRRTTRSENSSQNSSGSSGIRAFFKMKSSSERFIGGFPSRCVLIFAAP